MIDVELITPHIKQWAEARSPFSVIGGAAEITGGTTAHCRFGVRGGADVNGLKFALQGPAEAAVADVNQQVYDAAWAAVKDGVPPRWVYDFSSVATAVASVVDLEVKLGWRERGVLFVSYSWLVDHGCDEAMINEFARRLELRAAGRNLTLGVSRTLQGCPLVVRAAGFSFTAETKVTTDFTGVDVWIRYVARIADTAVLPVTACTAAQLAEVKSTTPPLVNPESRLIDLTAALNAVNATVTALLSKDPLHQFPTESPAGVALQSAFATIGVLTSAIAEEVRHG